MTRKSSAAGEKPHLLQFPELVKDAIGAALSVAQFGGKHPRAKPWKGEGPGVLEIVEDHRGDTFRAVYTVRFEHAIMCFMLFRKNRTVAQRRPNQISN